MFEQDQHDTVKFAVWSCFKFENIFCFLFWPSDLKRPNLTFWFIPAGVTDGQHIFFTYFPISDFDNCHVLRCTNQILHMIMIKLDDLRPIFIDLAISLKILGLTASHPIFLQLDNLGWIYPIYFLIWSKHRPSTRKRVHGQSDRYLDHYSSTKDDGLKGHNGVTGSKR